MKKIIMIGSSLLLLSSSVFATQSRLLALGMKETDNDGMYYIADARNMFLNAAYINLYSDQLVTEYGAAGKALGGKGTLDTAPQPKAQGGVFKKYGPLNYGVYLGNESNTSSLLRLAASTDATKILQTADNQLDLFVGGEAAVKWGVDVVYSNGKDETAGSKDNALATRFGVIGSNWDAHANISLASKSSRTDVDQEFKGKLGLLTGGSYNVVAGGKVFGYYKSFSWDQKRATGAMVGGDFSSYYAGYGQEVAVNGNDKVFVAVSLKKTDLNLNLPTKLEVRHLIIPVTLSYEARANEWLTLRGSVIQNIYGKKDNKGLAIGNADINNTAIGVVSGTYGANGKATISNSNEVNAGATLTFGKLAIDGLIGTTSSAGFDESTAGNGKKGVLSWSNLVTKAALTYKF